MRYLVFLALGVSVFVVSLSSPVQSQTHIWSQRFGGPSGENISFYTGGIATDASGNIAITGFFQGSVDFGGGIMTSYAGADVFIAKYDANGAHIWSQHYGNNSQAGTGIAFDNDGNVLVTGHFSGTLYLGGGPLTSAGSLDLFLAKYDPGGAHIWSKRIGGAGFEEIASVEADADGNVFLTGFFKETVDFGGGPFTAGFLDIFLVKYDPNGTHIWSRAVGGTGNDAGMGVDVDNTGNVFITGRFGSTVNFGGGPMTALGGEDIFVAKYNPSGVHQWSRGFGSSYAEAGRDVAVDGAGNSVATGGFRGSVDFGGGPITATGNYDCFLVKMDANGNHMWSHGIGSAGTYDQTVSLGIDSDDNGNTYVTGYFAGTIDFGGGPITAAGADDIFLARYNATGAHSWSYGFGDPAGDRGYDVSADPYGDVVFTGVFVDTVDFGGGPLVSAGESDIFVAKFTGDQPVPAALQAYDADWVRDHVEVTWRLTDSAGELSFDVSRRANTEALYVPIYNPEITPRQNDYVFEDHSAAPDRTYQYRVTINEDRQPIASFEATVRIPLTAFDLKQNHPNPFNPTTRIDFSLDREVRVTIAIYDTSGRLVKTLVDRPMAPGLHSETWDGSDNKGCAVASGAYFYRMAAGGHVLTRKAVLLK
jgi:hypothetical protein